MCDKEKRTEQLVLVETGSILQQEQQVFLVPVSNGPIFVLFINGFVASSSSLWLWLRKAESHTTT